MDRYRREVFKRSGGDRIDPELSPPVLTPLPVLNHTAWVNAAIKGKGGRG